LFNGIFKDETRINPRARNVQQNGHKCHAAITCKAKPVKINQFFTFTAAVQTTWP